MEETPFIVSLMSFDTLVYVLSLSIIFMYALLSVFVICALGLRDPGANLLRSGINLENVLDGKNLTAVILGATAVNNQTIQVVFEANITSAPPSLETKQKTIIEIFYAAENSKSLNLFSKGGLSRLFVRPDILNVSSLTLIPYSGATEINVNTLSAGFLFWHPELLHGNITHVYRCPNGESECESSLIHACAIKVAKNDPKIYVPFVTCMMSSSAGTSPEDASFSCSNSTSFMEDLRACALGQDGVFLQHELASRGSTMLQVPTIRVNGIIHPFNVTESVAQDFTKLICDAIFADGRLDRDACEGVEAKSIVVPFQSLVTQPVQSVSKSL
jgi:hypothetical protein